MKHRLRIAGATTEIFTGGALTEMYRVSGGVPRLLNVIGDRALLGGYSEDRHIITASRGAQGRERSVRPAPHAGLAALGAGWGHGSWSLPASPSRCGSSGRRAQDGSPRCPPTRARRQSSPRTDRHVAHRTATPPATTPPPAAPPPALNRISPTLLRNSAAVTDLDGAYGRLFALWSARYVAGSEDACSQALRQGLECLNETGGIEVLRRYNRPGAAGAGR